MDRRDNSHGVSRRHALIGMGGVALGLSAGSLRGLTVAQAADGKVDASQTGKTNPDLMDLRYPFRGEHQSGILTPAQQQMCSAGFDLTTDSRKELIALLKQWTSAAEAMTGAEFVGERSEYGDVPPTDTGETVGMGPAGLTITFGFGRSLFRSGGDDDRFGIGRFLPEELDVGYGDTPMANENLAPRSCDGDLMIQACAEDAMVSFHAIHNLARIAFGRAELRWLQPGYGRTSSTSTEQETPRNLFGFKDGTANIKAEDSAEELATHLWIQPGDTPDDVFAGGTYLCFRKIRMLMEPWDEQVLSRQERIIGRSKYTGAPLSGGDEFTAPDFFKRSSDGYLAIRKDSHVYVTHPIHNLGARMLRRGYNYVEGLDPRAQLDGGLFFIAFVRAPSTNFTPILRRMARDALTEYLEHVGSGMFVIPPGVKNTGEFIGQRMFEA